MAAAMAGNCEKEIWWPLSGGYRESVATTSPTPVSYYLNEAALMRHNDIMNAAMEKEQQEEKKRLQKQQDERRRLQKQQGEALHVIPERPTRPPPKPDDDSEEEKKRLQKQEDERRRLQNQQGEEALRATLQKKWPTLCDRPPPKLG